MITPPLYTFLGDNTRDENNKEPNSRNGNKYHPGVVLLGGSYIGL